MRIDMINFLKNFWKYLVGIFLIAGASAAIINLPETKITAQDLVGKYSQAPQIIKDKYVVEGSSFNMMAKNDWRDRIVAKVGNEIGDFEPKLRIERWDDEVDFSVKLIDNETGNPTVSFNSDKIVWQKGNKEVNFYDLPISVENPEGGYEFEVILKSKPATNTIQFALQTKGLDFFYQPELTPKEIAQGAFRPENIVGSYAVYASEQKTNWEGGKLYKTGKVGHIFRPKIIDSAGTEVWGDLHIENGILSVTIPQDFLDKAVYPVRHAAGLTFGYETVGGTSSYFESDIMKGSKFQPASSGSVSSVSIYLYQDFYSTHFKGVLTDNAGSILTNGITTTQGQGQGSYWSGWITSTYSTQPSVITSTDFWICGIGDNYENNFRYDTGSAGQGVTDTSNSYTTPTNPLTSNTPDTNKYSIYATYTAAGGGATVPVVSPIINFE